MKKDKVYVDQVNFLTVAGTLDRLRAIAFYRGDVGKMGTAARDMMSMGIETWLVSLSPPERKRFDDILSTVRTSTQMARDLKSNH